MPVPATEGYQRLFANFDNVIKPQECKKTGDAPSYLTGTMVRNGPGMFEVGDSKYRHWFDGLSYIQRYHFADGKMYYSARFLESDSYKEIIEKNRIVRSGFRTTAFPDPCKTIFQRFFSHFFAGEPLHDNANVSFAQVGDGLYAVTETPCLVRVDPDSLEVKGQVDMSELIMLHTCTAHQQLDEQGNVYNVGSRYGKDAVYVFAKTTNPLLLKGAESHSMEDTRLLGTIPCTNVFDPTYYHSFGMSANFCILFESPVRVNIRQFLVRKFTFKSYGDCIFWKEKTDTNVLLLDKRTGKKHIINYSAPPFFTFHHANSYEKDGFLVVDYCRMENPGNFDSLLMENMKDGTFSKNPNFLPYLCRMIIPLVVPAGARVGDDLLAGLSWATKGCKATLQKNNSIRLIDARLCNISMEFPRFHGEKVQMQDYRYCYGTSVLSGDCSDGIIKADVKHGKHQVWRRENEFQLCAEPIFVPDPKGVEEDDGVLVVPVMTLRDGDNPFVLVLDARNMQQIARYSIPQARIPFGFHAHYKQRVSRP